MTEAGASDAGADRRLTWMTFWALMAAALVGMVAGLPYALTIQGPLLASVADELPPLWVLLPVQVAQGLLLVALATGLGLWLGPRVGLGAGLLRDLLAGRREARAELRALVVVSVAWGVSVGAMILVLDRWVFVPRLPLLAEVAGAVSPPAWQGLLASFYGGIVEELLLRLGLMTVLVWIGARLTRATHPGPAVRWPAIIVAAGLFAVGHLPATAALLSLTPLVVVRALVLNGLGGVVFGWLYAGRGLVAAMIAHFTADLVLHVLAPVVSG